MKETYYFYEIRKNGRYGELVADSDGFDTKIEAIASAQCKLKELNNSSNVYVIKKEVY